jgi:hypothetical protein
MSSKEEIEKLNSIIIDKEKEISKLQSTVLLVTNKAKNYLAMKIENESLKDSLEESKKLLQETFLQLEEHVVENLSHKNHIAELRRKSYKECETIVEYQDNEIKKLNQTIEDYKTSYEILHTEMTELKTETEKVYKMQKFSIHALCQQVARHFFDKGQNTPKGMAPGGDQLWGLKGIIEDKYNEKIDSILMPVSKKK